MGLVGRCIDVSLDTEEDAGLLAHWYDLLANVVTKDTSARLVYNFDECGFRPGEGKSRNVIGSKSCPDLGESERGETITAVECIAADGWQMDPLFIFKAAGSLWSVGLTGAGIYHQIHTAKFSIIQ